MPDRTIRPRTALCLISFLFLTGSLFLLAQTSSSPSSAKGRNSWTTTVISPNGKIALQMFVAGNRLQYSATLNGKPVLEPSDFAITVDGVNIGKGVKIGNKKTYSENQTFPWYGVHSTAKDHANGARIAVVHTASKTAYTVEVQAFDDGIAFRTLVPGATNKSRVPEEATTFTIPAGSTVWYHDFHGHYEGRHTRKAVEDVPSGQWVAPPFTFQLAGGAGYGSITEADLVNYSGMGLQATGNNVFAARLGNDEPPSYPFTLRYGQAEAERLSHPAAIIGEITTPWRVVMIGPDLNTLVNSDIVADLSPPPDKELFPNGINTEWVKPGRAVWKYIDDPRPNTLETMKHYSDMAQELGFQYSVVEGMWQKWPVEDLKELVSYSEQRGVSLFLWKHSKELRTEQERQQFFQLCRQVGAAGVKIDFFDHEAKEIIDVYNVILKEAAENHLLVNFHGANKPTGESRTWPNELTREAVSGMESRNGQGRAMHDATLPFTRYLAGPADYTPVNFGPRRGDTTFAHQIATAVVFTEPLLTYGTKPEALLESPAVDLFKTLPSVWDETVVLPGSAIGDVAIFARRKGSSWFLGVVNGPEARKISIPLSFLGGGNYHTLLARDTSEGNSINVENSTTDQAQSVTLDLLPGGGFVERFEK